ncbi:sugar phosphate isomerase/epimerase [Marinobacter qingdaonensis]|uniref:Sugar phosphate isomerase/epimerase n=1 Tax=Marinobacter qingdaonensis TaxID=3108486 RepID=A0ABU5NZ27_9GAMM|nr:sugar phosphate isomerase/epimerase [Marinobacter sp. ASW11-75]MEA1081071.1 sugar phosphate isomerase/epimerase [Marinobacter sp. ASW11-75]MEE2762142.1 sugar phosphate isomerase/epimerase [Pseudomonadota bacterium]MEE3118771.1 sugar phosphate isomerase/epimerase [Pseudomonadota bacterium]
MQLKRFKTLWGHEGALQEAISQVIEADFDGIEAPVPETPEDARAFGQALSDNQLLWIQEVCTAGSYVPRRDASIDEHLQDFEAKLLSARKVGITPDFVNVMGGCDAWPIDDSVRFFSEAQNIADRLSIPVSFETHRGRSFFSPWNTVAILERLPDIDITCDFSHWAVVCERLPHIEWDSIERAAQQARHIHSRVGYDQGPQVPHPAAPEYAEALASHQSCWEAVWRAQQERGLAYTTMTPEFGTDGYLHLLPFTQAPIADLWSLNRWIGDEELAHFQRWQAARTQAQKIA